MDNQASKNLIDLQYKLHKEWLNHPVTNDAKKVLKSHFETCRSSLQERILTTSDEKAEANLRTIMKTCLALESLIFDSKMFVETLNRINK